MHNYRRECIEKRQNLQKNEDNLDFIRKVLDFTLVKVHNKTDTNSEFSPVLKKEEIENNRVKRSSSMDSIYKPAEEMSAVPKDPRRSLGKAIIAGIQAVAAVG